MPSIREYISCLIEVKKDLRSSRTKEALVIAADLKAIIAQRVQETGTDFQGQSFEDYTILYKVVRRKKGLQTEGVDFTDTGRLWNSIKPEIVSEDQDETTIDIKPRDPENQAKLDGQFAKRGNILLPSEDEIELVRDLNRERVLKSLKKIL